MLELEVFRKQIYGIGESTCDTVGTFRARELCPPFKALVTPLDVTPSSNNVAQSLRLVSFTMGVSTSSKLLTRHVVLEKEV